MKRCLFILYALVAMSLYSLAQGFDYDIWLDNRRDAMVHGKFTPGENTLTLDMSVVKTGGLHFLNVIPYYEWGEMGQWSCIPFIVPEGWPHTTNASYLEYQVYGYQSKPTRIPYDGTAYQLDIDISTMSPGLHFLNVRCFNEVGEAGPWKQIVFYISNFIFDREPLSYQYWIDKGEVHNCHDYYPGVVTLPVNIDDLTIGQHTFNYRVCYSNDPEAEGAEFGTTQTVKFDVAPKFGDVNADNAIDNNDVDELANYIMGKPSKKFKIEAADINQDGHINVADITELLIIINKNGKDIIHYVEPDPYEEVEEF